MKKPPFYSFLIHLLAHLDDDYDYDDDDGWFYLQLMRWKVLFIEMNWIHVVVVAVNSSASVICSPLVLSASSNIIKMLFTGSK